MKRSFTFLILLAAMALLTTSYSSGPFYAGTGNRTGSAGSRAGCDGPICHAAPGNTTALTVTLLRNGAPVTEYIPGQQYSIRLAVPISGGSHRNFGFQASVVRAADGVGQAGFLGTAGRADLATHQDVLVQLIEHNRLIRGTPVGGNYLDSVSFTWQAPAAGFGSVRVYAVVNAVDSSRTASGDQVRIAFQDFREQQAGTSIGRRAASQPAQLVPNPLPAGAAPLQIGGLKPGAPATCAISDMTGRLIRRVTLAVNSEGRALLPAQFLPSGQYSLLILQQEEQQVLRLQVK